MDNIDYTPTPHISAKKGDFAETVLMPGDPLRAKLIAENYFENAVLINNVRGMSGYTGTYKGKKVSVMASGMGGPSIGIYSYELFNFYDVKKIIRIGTAGTIDKNLHIKDIILAMGTCTNGNFILQYHLPGTFCPIADFDLLEKAVNKCREKNINFKVGNVLSSDVFYNAKDDNVVWSKMNVLGVEMEAAALYISAARSGKQALAILTVSDNIIGEEENMSADDRQNSLDTMIKLALDII